MNGSLGVVSEGVEGDGVRSVVVVRRAEEDKNKVGGLWDLFEYNGVFGRKMAGTWVAAAVVVSWGVCDVCEGLNLMTGLRKLRERGSLT